jgi:EAL domain-containing protein (putative c-di-GMP-specific phosphodiesterase class I)
VTERRTHWTKTGIPASRRSTPPPTVRGLTTADFDVVFQPIVELSSHRIFAYEALARCKTQVFANPSRLFAAASREGACGRLGRTIREVAFQRCTGVPLFINLHPDELSERWVVRPDDPIFEHDHHVFLEITESAAFSHFDLCSSVLRELKARGGFHLVVDDLGAGYSNLKRVVDLEPAVVKLDKALVTGLDCKPKQQKLVRFLTELCVELGAVVVAEGIETVSELSAVIQSGVHYGQGFVFAKPGYPLPKAKWPGGESVPPETAIKVSFPPR